MGDFNLTELWHSAIGQPNFKTYVNNCIKSKLTSHEGVSISILDTPLFKIAISTPYMLNFDNKYLIFKYCIKRIRKNVRYNVINMVVGREEVFEDSF